MASKTEQNPPKAGTVEPPPGIAALRNTQWNKPDYTLPLPSLQFLFHLECDMESFRHIGRGPHGDRSTVIFKGGRFEGPRLRGEILPGGGGKSPNLSPSLLHLLALCSLPSHPYSTPRSRSPLPISMRVNAHNILSSHI